MKGWATAPPFFSFNKELLLFDNNFNSTVFF